MSLRYLIILLGIVNISVVDAKTSLKHQWEGRWENVENIQKILPEEQPFKSVNIYDLLLITNVTSVGFDYINVANDVGYGRNEKTISKGAAIFIDKTHALDKNSGLNISYYQGQEKWDRGLSLAKSKGVESKNFKQIRTQFNASFNCEKAGTHIEKMICSDAVLARADKELGVLYKQLRKILSKKQASNLRSTQRAWNKNRNKSCQNKTKADLLCLSKFYASRLLLLRKMKFTGASVSNASIDKQYIKNLHDRTPNIWDDTIIRLILKSHQQNEFAKKCARYKPMTKAVFSNGEAVLSGKIEYETIDWPANILAINNYQLVINNQGSMWFSTSTNYGYGKGVETHFGPKEYPKSVVQWRRLINKQIKEKK